MSDSCDPTNCSPPGFPDQGVLQAGILEWVAISFSRGSSDPGIEPRPPALLADSSPTELWGKPLQYLHDSRRGIFLQWFLEKDCKLIWITWNLIMLMWLYQHWVKDKVTWLLSLWGCRIVWCTLTSWYLVSLLPVSIIHVSDIFLVGFWSWRISFIIWDCRGWGWQAARTWVSVSREMVGFPAPIGWPGAGQSICTQ